MKQITYILILAFGLWSCNKQTTEKTIGKTSTDSSKTISVSKQQPDIYIKDKSQYDQSFINGLSGFNMPIKLVDNYIIVGTNTIYFPEDLELNEKTRFTAFKDNYQFSITVIRTNLTNINYEFQLLDKDNLVVDSKAGQAVLGSGFFLAPEGDIDTEKDGYGSYEYREKSNDCWFSVRIGIGKDENGKRRAKLNYGCNDEKKRAIDLDDCPVLRTN